MTLFIFSCKIPLVEDSTIYSHWSCILLCILVISLLSTILVFLVKSNTSRKNTNKLLQKKNKELQEAKEKAETAVQAQSKFLSTITHELRTPLYAVTGLSQILLDENPRDDQIKNIESLKFSAEHLLTLINDILYINKLESEGYKISLESVSLENKISNIINALQSSSSLDNVELRYTYDKNLKENYITDKVKLLQILINVIGNATKFTKEGFIEVRVSKYDSTKDFDIVKFEIEDTGIGIDKDKLEEIFNRFTQGSVEINKEFGGTGLGLSIVKELVTALNGAISVQSELGKGTTFTIQLPMQVAVLPKKVNEKQAKKQRIKNIKVLLVEDNKINQMVTSKLLQKMNIDCVIVDNGESAILEAKENTYDVILMDINMPGITGFEATQKIREFNKEIIIIALTALEVVDKDLEFNAYLFNQVIVKPFIKEDFNKRLLEILLQKNKTNLLPTHKI